MRHFNYYENGGPFPSSCVSCGANKNIYGLTRELLSGGEAQICITCIKELSEFIGWANPIPLEEEIDILKMDVEAHERELARVPDHVEELINGIRSSVTDFIFAISYGDSVPRPEDDKEPELPVSQPSTSINNAKRSANPPIKPASK
jgi:hypothetical protein